VENSLFEIQYKPGEEVVIRFKAPDIKMVPKETKKHMMEAQHRVLVAVRDLLDKAIEKTEEKGKGKKTGRTKVDIQ